MTQRIIKFRAISKVKKEPTCYFTLDELMRHQVVFGNPEHWHFSEWTGLLDKNGKEIYEGDIVKSKHKITWEVRWDDLKDDRWALFTPETSWPQLKLTKKEIVKEKYEIIGNVFESPNLLT